MTTKFILFSTLSSVGFGLSNETTPPKKKVLVVIDVLDGYEKSFIQNEYGGWKWNYILSEHKVGRIVNGSQIVNNCTTCNTTITYDKGWNEGLDSKSMDRVADQTVSEIRGENKRKYDQLVFAHDFLDPETIGHFVVEENRKYVTEVPFEDYLSIVVGGNGTEIYSGIRKSLPEVTISSKDNQGTVNGIPTLYFRKQVDNAFTDDRTKIDVDDQGHFNPDAQPLALKLNMKGLEPKNAELYFVGILTNLCVQQTATAAVELGYDASVIMAGVAAHDDEQNLAGIKAMEAANVTIIW